MNPETVIGLSATTIALASLALGVWEGIQTRRHNRLSVTPHLLITNDFVGGDAEYGLLASNKGIGPAIVRELQLMVDGKRVAPDNIGGWGNARRQLGLDEPWNHCSGSDGMAISAGETVPLLAIKQAEQTDERCSQLAGALERLQVVLVYESMYGDRYVWPEGTAL